MNVKEIIDALGWYPDQVNGVEDKFEEMKKCITQWKEDSEKFREIVGQAGKPLTTVEEIWEWRKDAKKWEEHLKNIDIDKEIKDHRQEKKDRQIVEQLKKFFNQANVLTKSEYKQKILEGKE